MSSEDTDLQTGLEEFGDTHRRTLQKWGSQALDLAYPNPQWESTSSGLDELRHVVNGIGGRELQYSPTGGATVSRRRIAMALGSTSGIPYSFSDLFLTPGATAALATCFKALFSPGDEVLILAPCWMDYPLYLAAAGVHYKFVFATNNLTIDIDTILVKDQRVTPFARLGHTAPAIQPEDEVTIV